MKHYIICKLINKEKTIEYSNDIKDIFKGCLKIEGIHNVEVKSNIINRDNRFDLMIIIEMDKDALERYDACNEHHMFKERYGKEMISKTIIDVD